jgi:hypothetical protein
MFLQEAAAGRARSRGARGCRRRAAGSRTRARDACRCRARVRTAGVAEEQGTGKRIARGRAGAGPEEICACWRGCARGASSGLLPPPASPQLRPCPRSPLHGSSAGRLRFPPPPSSGAGLPRGGGLGARWDAQLQGVVVCVCGWWKSSGEGYTGAQGKRASSRSYCVVRRTRRDRQASISVSILCLVA